MAENKKKIDRRDFIRDSFRGGAFAVVGLAAGFTFSKARGKDMVWQIDPYKCTACGNCATYCVMEESAVKCKHTYAMCGYCKLCTGYYEPEPIALDTAAENQLCPTGAISRKYVEFPYYEYKVDEKLCNGCAKCVEGCTAFGNGSLYLQVCHDRCLNCNECAIAVACPSQAFKRVPASEPYLLKGGQID